MGLEIVEIKNEISDKKISASNRIDLLDSAIRSHHPLFLFSINFFPAIAEVCRIYNLIYICWVVDSPVLELFSKSIHYSTNRIFLFDKAQYNLFHSQNPTCIFHLPLASAVSQYDKVISTITETNRTFFSSDISFVGSLYTEKDLLASLALSSDTTNLLTHIINSSEISSDCRIIEQKINDSCISEFKNAIPDFYVIPDAILPIDRYIVANSYIGMSISSRERIQTLNSLAKFFSVDLYTGSETSQLHNVHIHGRVDSLTETPKVFHLSKINLNISIKPIQTGLPLRIFDIMGCNGFVITNHQEELTDYFKIGSDLESYKCLDELIDKCHFYLSHEDLRRQIAVNGYEKVKKMHSYPARIAYMFKKSFNL